MLFRLMQSTYVTPAIATATSGREEQKAHKENVGKIESPWFLEVQATRRRLTTLVVQSCERNGHPNRDGKCGKNCIGRETFDVIPQKKPQTS